MHRVPSLAQSRSESIQSDSTNYYKVRTSKEGQAGPSHEVYLEE
jgi:hypothetical protein